MGDLIRDHLSGSCSKSGEGAVNLQYLRLWRRLAIRMRLEHSEPLFERGISRRPPEGIQLSGKVQGAETPYLDIIIWLAETPHRSGSMHVPSYCVGL